MPKQSKARKAERPTYRVFVSHSSADRWVAGQMSKEIEATGAGTWLDEKDLQGGDELEPAILDGIEGSREGIVLVSSRSAKSWWVLYEIGAFRIQKKRVTPVLMGIEAKGPLAGLKAIDLNDFDTYLVQLRKRIG